MIEEFTIRFFNALTGAKGVRIFSMPPSEGLEGSIEFEGGSGGLQGGAYKRASKRALKRALKEA